MNEEDARQAVMRVARQRFGQTYHALAQLVDGETERHEVEVHGVTYQVTFRVYWDDKPGGLLRLWYCVDDSGPRAFFPLTMCDLIATDQVFQGALE